MATVGRSRRKATKSSLFISCTLHSSTARAVAVRGGIGVVSDFTKGYLDTPDATIWNNGWSETPNWYGGKEQDKECKREKTFHGNLRVIYSG